MPAAARATTGQRWRLPVFGALAFPSIPQQFLTLKRTPTSATPAPSVSSPVSPIAATSVASSTTAITATHSAASTATSGTISTTTASITTGGKPASSPQPSPSLPPSSPLPTVSTLPPTSAPTLPPVPYPSPSLAPSRSPTPVPTALHPPTQRPMTVPPTTAPPRAPPPTLPPTKPPLSPAPTSTLTLPPVTTPPPTRPAVTTQPPTAPPTTFPPTSTLAPYPSPTPPTTLPLPPTVSPPTPPPTRLTRPPASPSPTLKPPSSKYDLTSDIVMEKSRSLAVVRVSDTPANLEGTHLAPLSPNVALVQQYIKASLPEPWKVEEDSFVGLTPFGNKTFNNIWATLHPNAPRRIILSAHFDSKYFASSTFIGATDSAVPCAILLRIAEKLAITTIVDPNVTIQLVFFDGEEAFVAWTSTDSIYGSRHLAAKWAAEDNIKNIDAMLLLDLLGADNPKLFSHYENTKPLFNEIADIHATLKSVGICSKTRTYFYRNNGVGGVEDDHKPFLALGVPIVHLIATPFPTVWHTPNDNMDAIVPQIVQDLTNVFFEFCLRHLK